MLDYNHMIGVKMAGEMLPIRLGCLSGNFGLTERAARRNFAPVAHHRRSIFFLCPSDGHLRP